MPPEPPAETPEPPVEASPLAFRCAQLQLRGPAGPLPARVSWPAGGSGGGRGARPGLLVLVDGDGTGGGRPSAHVVVALHAAACTFEAALAATLWAADHAEELGADPGRLLVAGTGDGVAVAAAVVAWAREEGWPPVRPAGDAQGWAS